MIRRLQFSSELATIMTDGMSTCNHAMHALTIYFREHVYGRIHEELLHVARIDENVISIMTSAIETDDPHLKGAFKVEVVREHPYDIAADLIVTIDDVYKHLVSSQQGFHLCH